MEILAEWLDLLRYAELSRHVWVLWREARHLDPIDPAYRAWIVERTLERTINAAQQHPNATDELGQHLLHDYTPHLNPVERDRFTLWWQYVMERGFNTDNPLANLHKPTRRKVGTK